MKKGMLAIAALVVLSLLAVACGNQGAQTGQTGTQTAAQTATINIGFIGPMSGDYANYGKLISQGVRLAVEKRNAEAAATTGITFNPIVEDSEGDQAKGVSAFEKLASQDKVLGLVGEVFSSISLAIAPRAEAEKVVMISPSSTHPEFPGKGEYIFRTIASDAVQADTFARYVATELKLTKVAVLYTKNDYSQTLAESFKAVFEAQGGQVVAWESCNEGDKDFKTQLTKIKAANPEAIYLPNYVAEIAQILEQGAGLGISTSWISGDGFSNPEILSTAGKFAEGVVFSASPNATDDATTVFNTDYKAKFGDDPDDFARNAYDAANIIMDAIAAAYAAAGGKVEAIDRAAIQKYVAAVKGYKGVSGDVTFDAAGDLIKNFGIKKVTNGAFEQIGVYKVEAGQFSKVQ